MAKMSPEQKLAAVQRYINGKESSRTVAADFGISHRYLLSLVKQHEHNGVETFVRRYTNYTKAFKLDVLNYMTEYFQSITPPAPRFTPLKFTICTTEYHDLHHQKNKPPTI